MTQPSTRLVDRTRRRGARSLRRLGFAAALAVAVLSNRALAHPDHAAHDDGGSGLALPALLFGLGGALVVAGLALDRRSDLPRQYVDGLVLGGAALVLLLAPLLWWF